MHHCINVASITKICPNITVLQVILIQIHDWSPTSYTLFSNKLAVHTQGMIFARGLIFWQFDNEQSIDTIYTSHQSPLTRTWMMWRLTSEPDSAPTEASSSAHDLPTLSSWDMMNLLSDIGSYLLTLYGHDDGEEWRNSIGWKWRGKREDKKQKLIHTIYHNVIKE